MVHCPLPIDWLDYLEGVLDAPDASHLRTCGSCREVVAALRSQQPGSVGSRTVAAPKSFSAWTAIGKTRPSPGEVWLTVNAMQDGAFSFESDTQIPVLVLNMRGSGKSLWFDVAPVGFDPETATQTDLILQTDETSLECEVRLMFRLQTVLGQEQLHTCVGTLRPVGQEVVDQALRGSLPSDRVGLPLDNEDDERLIRDASLAEALRRLGSYWSFVNESAETETTALVFTLHKARRIQRIATRAQPLAAASASSGPLTRSASVKWNRGGISQRLIGYVQLDVIPNDTLWFYVTEAATDIGLTFRIRLTAAGKNIATPPLAIPLHGGRVLLTEGAGLTLNDIERLELVWD